MKKRFYPLAAVVYLTLSFPSYAVKDLTEIVPDDILTNVVSYLKDPKDNRNVSLVSKRLNRIANHPLILQGLHQETLNGKGREYLQEIAKAYKLAEEIKAADEKAYKKAIEQAPHANHLLELPDEILLNIFSFVNPQDLFNLSLVCKPLKPLSESNQLWKKFLSEQDIKDAEDKSYHQFYNTNFQWNAHKASQSWKLSPVLYTFQIDRDSTLSLTFGLGSPRKDITHSYKFTYNAYHACQEVLLHKDMSYKFRFPKKILENTSGNLMSSTLNIVQLKEYTDKSTYLLWNFDEAALHKASGESTFKDFSTIVFIDAHSLIPCMLDETSKRIGLFWKDDGVSMISDEPETRTYSAKE